MRVFGEGCSRQKEQPVQRRLGRSMSGMSKEKQEGRVARVKGAMRKEVEWETKQGTDCKGFRHCQDLDLFLSLLESIKKTSLPY